MRISQPPSAIRNDRIVNKLARPIPYQPMDIPQGAISGNHWHERHVVIFVGALQEPADVGDIEILDGLFHATPLVNNADE